MTSTKADLGLAMQLIDEGKVDEAKRMLEQLSIESPSSSAVFAALGNVQWDLNLLSDAIMSFRRAVELAPHSEKASLGLFHTLMESEHVNDAFGEMRRFMSSSDSEEYRQLLREINNPDV